MEIEKLVFICIIFYFKWGGLECISYFESYFSGIFERVIIIKIGMYWVFVVV